MLQAAGLPNLLGLLDVQVGPWKLWESHLSTAEVFGSCRPSVSAWLSASHSSDKAQIQGNLEGIHSFR